jgi:anti-sigma regulatory factor (Ser/Thr protein kinase)
VATRPQIPLTINEESSIGNARRRAQQIAADSGLSESNVAKIAIIASESATNIVKHGGTGELLLRELAKGVEVVAVDKGPGMRDASKCLADGYSTGGTAGTGLGAIRRLSSGFDIYSQPEAGTALVARLTEDPSKNGNAPLRVGVICRPKHGEALSGDGWTGRLIGNSYWLMVADGLGHGPDANEAAAEAVRVFSAIENPRSTTDCMEVLHGALRKTRGAAVAVLQLDREARQVRCSGVGNIAAAIVESWSSSRSLVSHNGILGHEVRRIQEFSSPWAPGSKLIVNSDGLATWHLERYPGLLQRDPAVIAAVLYRDYWRPRDDVTVLVVQEDANA